MVRLSPPFGATDPCLVFHILIDLRSVIANGTKFLIVPHGGRQMFLPVDSIAFVLLTTVTRPIVLAFVRAFFRSNTLNLQRQRGALEVVFTLTLKSILGQRNKNVCLSPSLKNWICAYPGRSQCLLG